MTTIKEKARAYAERKWEAPENSHLKIYCRNDYEAGFQECARLTLAPLTQEERKQIAAEIYEHVWGAEPVTLVRTNLCEDTVDRAFSTFFKLRGINPKVQSQ